MNRKSVIALCRKGILVMLLGILHFAMVAQCPPANPCEDAQLTANVGAVLANIPYTQLSAEYNQKARLKSLKLKVHLALEKNGVYPLSGLDWSASLSLQCTFKNASSTTLRVRDIAIDLVPNIPEAIAEIDVTDIATSIATVEVKLIQYNVNGGQENLARANVQCDLELVRDAAFDVLDASATPYTILDPQISPVSCVQNTNEVCQVKFSWQMPKDRFVPQFEVELLKMEPKIQNSPLDVDWTRANRLLLETGSSLLQNSPGQGNQIKYQFTYLLAEGSGYYAWRVRPIGDYYDGGMSSAKNYGKWNTTMTSFANHGYSWTNGDEDLQGVSPSLNLKLTGGGNPVNGSVFYYEQFDEEKNWIYGRIFSEGSRIAETITYANGLSQTQQVQTKSYSQNQVLGTQSVLDFSGRPAMQSMVAPTGSDQLQYRNDFFRKAGNLPYQASDFDSNPTIYPGSPNIDASKGPGFYYSDQNSNADYPNGDLVPDAKGFPYTRTLFYPDATGRVYKQSAPGEVMRLKNASSHNVTTFYGAVTQGELDIIFGNEAPVDTTVYKIVSLDPNSVSSVSYVAKNGTVLATCLSHNGSLSNLEDVGNENEPGTQVLEYRLDGGNFAPGDETAKKQTTIIVEQAGTVAPFYYEITPQSFGIPCAADLCYTCDYRIEFLIVLTQDPDLFARFYFDISPLQLANCQTSQSPLVLGSSDLPYSLVQFDPANTLPPFSINDIQAGTLTFPDAGTYLITKSIHTNNPTGTGNFTYLDTYLDTLATMREGWTADSNCCGPIVIDTTDFSCGDADSWCDSTLAKMADSLRYWVVLEQSAAYKQVLTNGGSGLTGNSFPNASSIEALLDFMIVQKGLNCSEVWACFQLMGGMLEQNMVAIESGGSPIQTNPSGVPPATGNPPGPQYDPDFDFIQGVLNCTGVNDPCRNYKKVMVWWGTAPTNVPDSILALEIPPPGQNSSVPPVLYHHLSCVMGSYTFDPALLSNQQLMSNPNFGLSNQETAAAICDCKNNPPDPNATVSTNADSLQTAMSDRCEDACENRRTAFGQAIDNWVVEYNQKQGIISMIDPNWISIDSIMGLDRECIIERMVDQCQRQCGLEMTRSIVQDSLDQSNPAYSQAYADSILSGTFQELLRQERLEFEQAMTWNAQYAPVKDPQSSGGYSDFGTVDVVQDDLLAFIRNSMDNMLQHPTHDVDASSNPGLFYRSVSGGNLVLSHRNAEFIMPTDSSPNPTYKKFTAATNLLYNSSTGQLEELNLILFCDFGVDTTGPRNVYSGTEIGHWAFQPNHGLCPRLDAFFHAAGLQSGEIVKFHFDRRGTLHAVLSGLACPGDVDAAGICPKAYPAAFSFQVSPGGNSSQDLRIEIASHLDFFDLFSPPLVWDTDPIVTASAIVMAINQDPNNPPFVAHNLDLVGNPTSTVTIEISPGYIGPIESLELLSYGNLALQNITGPTWCGVPLDSLVQNSQCTSMTDSESRKCPFGFFEAEDKYSYPNTSQGIDQAIDDMIGFVGESATSIIKMRTPESTFYSTQLGFNVYRDIDTLDFRIGDAEFRCQTGFAWNGEEKYFHSSNAPNNRSVFNYIPNYLPNNSEDSIVYYIEPGNIHYFWFRVDKCPNGSNQRVATLNLARLNGTQSLWPAYINPNSLPPGFSALDDMFELFLEPNGRLKFTSQNDNSPSYGSTGISHDLQSYPSYVSTGGIFRNIIASTASANSPCGVIEEPCEVCMRWSLPGNPEELLVPAAFEPYSCEQAMQDYIDNTVASILDSCLRVRQEEMKESYFASCLGNIQDKCSIEIEVAYHHYTLYYRDRANNLVATVPPEGVDFLSSPSEHAQVQAHRSNTSNNAPLYPAHTLETNYQYNSIGQVIEQTSPDGGTSKFWYNAAGQLVLSQDAQQALESKYSYSRYDRLGRIVESGILTGFTPSFSSSTPAIITQLWDQLTFPENLPPSVNKWEVVHTEYTLPTPGINYDGMGQTHLRNRIGHIWKDENDNGQSKNHTWYSYDEHGNVQWLIQDIPAIGRKRMRYEYDLVSGNVKKVWFQEGTEEQFVHRYEYDADNRIVNVFTSKDNHIWERDAGYQYYLHGPLARKEIGEDKLQGMDYVYTIEGYLKSINQVELDSIKDPGQDGTQLYGYIKDEFAMELGYYQGDYARTGTHIGQDNAAVYPYNASGGLTTPVNDLYNGNISYWMSNIRSGQQAGPDINPVALKMRHFRYDKLNRLRKAVWRPFENGTWQADDGTYNEAFTYDGNGNILTLLRNGYAGTNATIPMDQLSYHYNIAGGMLQDNRLYHLNDAVNSSPYADDLEDQGLVSNTNFTTSNNYRYDAEGNLTTDLSEGILEIKWNAINKVKEVVKSNDEHIYFIYDAMGNRIVKSLTHQPSSGPHRALKTTFYVRDASGNPMAIYTQTYDPLADSTKLLLEELPIYGSDRVGMYQPKLVLEEYPGYITDPQQQSYEDPALMKTWLIPRNPQVAQAAFSASGTPQFSTLSNSQNTQAKAHAAIQTDENGDFLFGAVVTDVANPMLLVIGKDQNPMNVSGGGVFPCGKGLNMEPVIIPKPGVANHYYIVYHSASGFSSVRALEVDMEGNGGNGTTIGNPIAIGNPNAITGNVFGHKILAFTYQDGQSRLLLNAVSPDGKSLTLYRIEVSMSGFSAPRLIGVIPMPYGNPVSAANDLGISPDGKHIAIGLHFGNSPLGVNAPEFYDVVTWELDLRCMLIQNFKTYALNSGRVRRVEFSPSGDYLFVVKQEVSGPWGNRMDRLKLSDGTALFAGVSLGDMNIQRIQGGYMLHNFLSGNSFNRILNPETNGTSFSGTVFASPATIKRGEFPQPTYPVDGSLQEIRYEVKSTDRHWIASTSGSNSASGYNTLEFDDTGLPIADNPVALNVGLSRNVSIGENRGDTLDFRYLGLSGWNNLNFTFREDNSLIHLGSQGEAELPSIAVELPGDVHGYYIFTCAYGNLKWHKLTKTGGQLAMTIQDQDLKVENGNLIQYDQAVGQVAFAAYNDHATGGGSFLFAAVKHGGMVYLYSFRLYPDHISPGILVKQYGTQGAANDGLFLSEMQVSPDGQEMSLSISVEASSGLPIRHRFERFRINPTLRAGLRYLGMIEVQGEAVTTRPLWPEYRVLSHDYSPDGEYIYFFQKGVKCPNFFQYPSLHLKRINLLTSIVEEIEDFRGEEDKGVIRRGRDGRMYLNYQKRNPGNNYVPYLYGYGDLDNETPAVVASTRIQVDLEGGLNNYGLPLQSWRRYGDCAPAEVYAERRVCERVYEMNDHLGNVRVTLGDWRGHLLFGGSGLGAAIGKVETIGGYYGFGSPMVGRSEVGPDYRFGFQGQERDEEIKGIGNSINYKFRIHDPRTGRFFSRDQLSGKYPYYSPYAFSGNRVIDAVELEGLEPAKPKSGANNLIIVIQGYVGVNPPKNKTQANHDPNSYVDYGGLGDIKKAFGNKSETQVVIFSSSHAQNTINDAASTITDFKAANPEGKIIIVGHSLGADNAVNLGAKVEDVAIDLMITLDIADYWDDDNISSNVKDAVNFFQNNDWPGGEDIEAIDPSKTNIQNFEALESTHTTIDNDFAGTVIQMIEGTTGVEADYKPTPQNHDKVKKQEP